MTVLIAVALLTSASGQNVSVNREQGGTQSVVKPVSADVKVAEYPSVSLNGPSWIKHLNLTVSQTHLGQMGGNVSSSSAASAPVGKGATSLGSNIQRFLSALRAQPQQASAILNEQFQVAGADLYRWNCQSCHGPTGEGAVPEINSVIGPVQGTSPILTKKRMEGRGLDVDDDMVQQVTDLADGSLRDRLKHGGKNMPSFEYLRADEVEALYGYLEKLASVPPTKRDGLLVPESAARVGEHIVRGTCHVCHDATGPGAGQIALLQGTLPSLASLPKEHSLSGVVHQVHFGSCGMMKTAGAEVMPAYPYFTDEEIASVYFLVYSAKP
jgi:mono/diheme cytochrome c family protein